MSEKYSIVISKKEYDLLNSLCTSDNTAIFNNSAGIHLHAHAVYFNYYKKRIPFLEIKHQYTDKKIAWVIEPKELHIKLVPNSFLKVLFNTFNNKSNQVFYIDRASTNDIEKTWKNIQKSRRLNEYHRIVFNFNHFSKMVYAYRAKVCYGIDIKDITH